MLKHYKLNENHEIEECLMEEAWNLNKIDRIIGRTMIGDVKISTVFLTIDHQYGDGPPILFETMIFGGEHDQWQDRYHTYQEAIVGHLEAIDMVRGFKKDKYE